MPAHNAEKYIAESIESVLYQTYENWELIIVDDYSSDLTRTIANKYAEIDSRIKVVPCHENVGVSRARNKGLDEAIGTYIAFLDSDDIWKETKLEKQVAFMKDRNCAFCFSSYQRFNSGDLSLGKVIKAPKSLCAADVLTNTVIGCLTVIINREMTGAFYMPVLTHMEDNATWFLILSRGFKAYGISESLAYYRVHNRSASNNKFQAAFDQWKVYRSYFSLSPLKTLKCFSQYALNAIGRY